MYMKEDYCELVRQRRLKLILELTDSCLTRLEVIGPDQELQSNIENQLQEIEELRPRSFFKRFLFDRQVRRLKQAFSRLHLDLEILP